MIAGTANASVFDPQGSFLHIRIGALRGESVSGRTNATDSARLSGVAGNARIQQRRKGFPPGAKNLFQVKGQESGTEFFTGTPTIENLFFTLQNSAGTFEHGTSHVGTFQGNTLCTSGCFGGSAQLFGQVLVQVTGPITVPVALDPIGAGGTGGIALGSASIAIEGAQWISGTASITNIATNLVEITNNPNGRINATGVGFTLALTVNENTFLQAENGVTVVTVAGTTDFETASETSGVNQVKLVSPIWVNASTVTGNPPIPALAVEVLRYVPEPGTLLLLGSAVAGLLVVGRKRMKR